MRLLPPLVLLALLGAAMPMASAGQGHGHHYQVLGRVLDATGAPVAGLEVRLALEGVDDEGSCPTMEGAATEAFGPARGRPTTDEEGAFAFCRHVHGIPRGDPGRAVLGVPAANATETVALDPDFRASFLVLQLPVVRPEADATPLAERHVVAGRVWRPGDETEAVGSRFGFGEAVERVPVNLTLVEVSGETRTAQSTTDVLGDFAVRIPVGASPEGGRVRVEVLGQTYEETLSPAGATYLKIEAGASSGGAGGPSSRDGPGAVANEAPLPPALVLLGLGLAAAGAAAASARRRS